MSVLIGVADRAKREDVSGTSCKVPHALGAIGAEQLQPAVRVARRSNRGAEVADTLLGRGREGAGHRDQ